MTEVVFSGDIFPAIGCKDPLANNYSRSATGACLNCCRYGSKIVGCTDPLAINYDSKATDSCTSCCTYQVTETQPVDYNVNLNSLLSARFDPPPGPGSPSVLDINCEFIGVSKNKPFNDPIDPGNGISFRTLQLYNFGSTIQENFSFFDSSALNNPLAPEFDGTIPSTISLAQWYYFYGINHQSDFGYEYPQLWASLYDFVERGGVFYVNTSATGGDPYGLLGQTCCGQIPPVEVIDENTGNLIGTFSSGGHFDNNTLAYTSTPLTSSQQGYFLPPNQIQTNSYETYGNPNSSPNLVNPLNSALVPNPPYLGVCEDAYYNWINDGGTPPTGPDDGGGGTGPDDGGGGTGPGDTTTTCIATINDFINLINTGSNTNQFSAIGGNFFNTYFPGTIGPALGLTPQQILFIKNNINSTLDSNGNNTPDLSEARLILSNALQNSGGFYVSQPTTSPSLVSQANCVGSGKYWDNNNKICMCAPLITQECLIDITQVQVVTTPTTFGNSIQTIVYNNGNPLSEACCNRLIRDYNLVGVWQWQSPNCVVLSSTVEESCLPAVFSLNNNDMSVPPCGDVVEISMWLYFETPDNPCQPILKQVYNDIINVEIPADSTTRTPNLNLIDRNPASSNISFINVNSSLRDPSPDTTTSSEDCCYDSNEPILAKISLNNSLNSFLTQIKEYSSIVDGFDNWVELKATIPSSGVSLNFGVNLEIYQGLSCCCNYDFFVDDIKVGCPEERSIRVRNDVNCIGFNLTKVIDNKKSWVYNPGLPSVGITEYDAIERADGSFSLLNGEGTINRTFAPSLDADIPWRYTDYWKQSSVYEKHSNLVLNSKELWLTFDMCADCPISGTTLLCPQGYTLSANTTICYSGNT